MRPFDQLSAIDTMLASLCVVVIGFTGDRFIEAANYHDATVEVSDWILLNNMLWLNTWPNGANA